MKSESVIREEPGEYRVTARYSEDGTFLVIGETVKPITLTVRVEDVWNRVPEGLRRYSYRVAIWRDDVEPASNILERHLQNSGGATSSLPVQRQIAGSEDAAPPMHEVLQVSLENVAPDARIFLDFSRSFRMEFK